LATPLDAAFLMKLASWLAKDYEQTVQCYEDETRARIGFFDTPEDRSYLCSLSEREAIMGSVSSFFQELTLPHSQNGVMTQADLFIALDGWAKGRLEDTVSGMVDILKRCVEEERMPEHDETQAHFGA
jgi:hypothetical protein